MLLGLGAAGRRLGQKGPQGSVSPGHLAYSRCSEPSCQMHRKASVCRVHRGELISQELELERNGSQLPGFWSSGRGKGQAGSLPSETRETP